MLLLPSSSQTMAFLILGVQAGFVSHTSLIYPSLFCQHWNDLKLKFFSCFQRVWDVGFVACLQIMEGFLAVATAQ